MRAVGAILHDVYHGAERICLLIAGTIDEDVPQGDSSHRALIDQMSKPYPEKRTIPVIEFATKEGIESYRGFRHVFRHTYGFELDWARMEPLLGEAHSTIDAFRQDIQEFIAFLRMISN
ncbi:MAG: hypothetical protein R3264_09625 [Anaerolineae bacterium]|nr:hypothetical protein [Anaerolineae bacterium]